MTLVPEITALTTRATALFDVYEQKAASIDASVNAAIAAIPATTRYYAVDQINGDDNADGTSATPFRSIDKALQRTPQGGVCVINVAGAYHFDSIVDVRNTQVELRGQGTRPKLSFGWVPSTVQVGKIARLAGFRPFFFAGFRFENLTVELPDDPAEAFEYTHMNGVVANSGSNSPSLTAMKFVNCDLTIKSAASTEATLRGEATGFSVFEVVNSTLPANMAGRFIKGLGGTGVDPTTLTHRVVTNISTI